MMTVGRILIQAQGELRSFRLAVGELWVRPGGAEAGCQQRVVWTEVAASRVFRRTSGAVGMPARAALVARVVQVVLQEMLSRRKWIRKPERAF
jgi:hypothetical protein